MMMLSTTWGKTTLTFLAMTGNVTPTKTKVAQPLHVRNIFLLFVRLSLKLEAFIDGMSISVTK